MKHVTTGKLMISPFNLLNTFAALKLKRKFLGNLSSANFWADHKLTNIRNDWLENLMRSGFWLN